MHLKGRERGPAVLASFLPLQPILSAAELLVEDCCMTRGLKFKVTRAGVMSACPAHPLLGENIASLHIDDNIAEAFIYVFSKKSLLELLLKSLLHQ